MLVKFISTMIISVMLYIPADNNPTTGFWRLDRMYKIEQKRMDKVYRKKERSEKHGQRKVERVRVRSS